MIYTSYGQPCQPGKWQVFWTLERTFFISGGQFYAEDFSSFDSLVFKRKTKRWSTAFRGSTESFSFRQRILKTCSVDSFSRLDSFVFHFDREFYSTDNNEDNDFIRLDKILRIKNLEKNMDEKEWLAHNKNYMSIGVSVRTTKFAARKNGIGVRQESNPQSPTAYSSFRCGPV